MDTSEIAGKAMEATGETGSNTRMGLSGQSEVPRDDPRDAKALKGAVDEEEEKARRKGIQKKSKEGQKQTKERIMREQARQAVPKADEFEQVDLTELYGI